MEGEQAKTIPTEIFDPASCITALVLQALTPWAWEPTLSAWHGSRSQSVSMPAGVRVQ